MDRITKNKREIHLLISKLVDVNITRNDFDEIIERNLKTLIKQIYARNEKLKFDRLSVQFMSENIILNKRYSKSDLIKIFKEYDFTISVIYKELKKYSDNNNLLFREQGNLIFIQKW